MHVTINLKDIAFAEGILLKPGERFDPERISFIQDLTTLDVQAVPGSGKTTALLAKLLILERKLPLDGGKGILVLSHTNTAVDEIREKVAAYCPKLFSYPNFIGTIQSFVNQFLAIPHFCNKNSERPYIIDDESYNDAVAQKLKLNLKGFSRQENKNAKYFLMSNDNLARKFRLYFNGPDVKVQREMNGAEINVSKPGRTNKKWSDFDSGEKARVYDWMVQFKTEILKHGVLHYDDAYFLANAYLRKFPNAKILLQKRFLYVFVDEMQDMEQHQHDLLEEIFFDGGRSESFFQRLGDLNQAIFNGKVGIAQIWNSRTKCLPITGSHRLSASLAEIVNCFALDQDPRFQIVGLRPDLIKPHMIVYQPGNIGQVLPTFSKRIAQCITDGHIGSTDKKIFKAIGWTKGKEDKRTKIANYCDSFNVRKSGTKVTASTLDGYLKSFDPQKRTLKAAKKLLLEAICKVLQLEAVTAPSDGRVFSASQLIKFLESDYSDEAAALKKLVYIWAMKLACGSLAEVGPEIKAYVSQLLALFKKKIVNSATFLDEVEPDGVAGGNAQAPLPRLDNKVNFHGFDIEVTTIHAVKGQTHTATLYLETFNDKGGGGNYESQRLSNQFKFNALPAKSINIVKQTSKMAYVGLSRPTHLLCVAVQKDRFDAHLSDVDRNKWEVIEI